MQLEIQAHRANSPAAVFGYRAAGATSIEIDVGVSLDGEVLCVHDVHEPLTRELAPFDLGLALAMAQGTPVIVEAKSFPPSTPSPRAFARALSPFLQRIALASFDERVLAEARRLHPQLPTTFLFDTPLRVATTARTIGPHRGVVTRDLVQGAHSVGLRVVPWTVNDAYEMRALLDLGVDGIVTDEPALLGAVASELAVAA